jgi:hypothetical protein
MHIFGKGFNFEIMMKHHNNRIIISNEACKFFDPANFNFQSFISLLLTNKFRNEKAEILFQFNKNQHLEKMLVFFCDKFRKYLNSFPQEITVGFSNPHATRNSVKKYLLSDQFYII